MFISASFSHSFFLVRGQQVGKKKPRKREEASVSLSFDVDRGGGGQRTLDKEPRGGREEWKEEQMKNIHVEKHWVIFPSWPFPLPPSLLLLFVLAKTLPHHGAETEKGALVPSGAGWGGVSSLKKVWPLQLLRKSTREEEHFLSAYTTGWFPFLPLGLYNRCHITSTKNSPALPTAIRRDCRDAVSSGGTEASSLPGGAPGAAVERCGGWGGRPGGPYTRPGP